jgi:hypothetical protein
MNKSDWIHVIGFMQVILVGPPSGSAGVELLSSIVSLSLTAEGLMWGWRLRGLVVEAGYFWGVGLTFASQPLLMGMIIW